MMSRQKSISKRMLSKVKEGISHKSRSPNNIRATGSETSLMRRLSGKRKQSSQAQSRASSFEVSRDSIGSQLEDYELELDTSASQRSFTDTSTSTNASLSGTGMTTPPSAITSRSAHGRQTPARALQASPRLHSPSQDLTPRPPTRSGTFAYSVGGPSALSTTVPYVDLSVTVDRDCVDVGLTRDVWVAVDATIRTKVVDSPTAKAIRKTPLDVIIVLCQDTLAEMPNVTHSCVIELLSRLETTDRMAVVVASDDECCQLLALQPAKTTVVLERLGIAPSMINDSYVNVRFGEIRQPLQNILRFIADQGVRDSAQVVAVCKNPDSLVHRIRSVVQWPTHAFKIGFGPNPTHALGPHDWSIAFTGTGGCSNDLLDNMIRDLRHGCPMGLIPSLRLCYKPLEQCRIVEVLGQKAVRDLKLGQRCPLFLKVHVPKFNTSERASLEELGDADSLLTELESIVGTLETDFLHVEARYRHSALPTENVVTLRHICSIKRPKTDSRWSVVGPGTVPCSRESVQAKLAQYIASNYDPSRALKMIDRWTLQQATASDALRSVRNYLETHAKHTIPLSDNRRDAIAPDPDKPSVVITDIDMQPLPEVFPLSSSKRTNKQQQQRLPQNSPSTSISGTKILTSRITAPKPTTAITLTTDESPSSTARATTPTVPTDSRDTARQLWRHIRRSSLSAQQLMELSPDRLNELEASDETLKALRSKALANKRSIGAETLKAWRWEEKMMKGEEAPTPTAPWM
ncbi:Hypothetical predicted protein [Lecanosticta acicola]|uniref:Uncharacterized protein n=1 Tax=Lecanosticta acicola TaxID=111012 RepID=A0AAI8W125_9PEZI|nr:Hypothetical predicted protein [Lecanosticta acicola]